MGGSGCVARPWLTPPHPSHPGNKQTPSTLPTLTNLCSCLLVCAVVAVWAPRPAVDHATLTAPPQLTNQPLPSRHQPLPTRPCTPLAPLTPAAPRQRWRSPPTSAPCWQATCWRSWGLLCRTCLTRTTRRGWTCVPCRGPRWRGRTSRRGGVADGEEVRNLEASLLSSGGVCGERSGEGGWERGLERVLTRS